MHVGMSWCKNVVAEATEHKVQNKRRDANKRID